MYRYQSNLTSNDLFQSYGLIQFYIQDDVNEKKSRRHNKRSRLL